MITHLARAGFYQAGLPLGFIVGDFMFDRLKLLIGEENIAKIASKKVLLVGLGGVGGFVFESLVRSGIKNFTVCDGDTFDTSNLNRQILANQNNIGLNKALEAKNRALSINPDINIEVIDYNLTKDNINKLGAFDYIIDACDDVSAKIELIKYAINNNIKIICSMGTGKRLDPTKLAITRIDKTYNDPLAKVMRSKLKKEGITLKIPCVASTELSINNDKVIASSIFVPATAGIYLASFVITDIILNNSSI